jgi:hypothetical protein
MKKTNRIQVANEIIARVKKEMDRPRLTESVRNPVKRPAARSAAILLRQAAIA